MLKKVFAPDVEVSETAIESIVLVAVNTTKKDEKKVCFWEYALFVEKTESMKTRKCVLSVTRNIVNHKQGRKTNVMIERKVTGREEKNGQ